MGSISSAWNIAAGALEADQAALNVVANNTANANTPGYTRQVPNWQENDSVSIGGLSVGMGVSFTGATSQRDRILEQSVQQQSQVTAAGSARLTALDQLQGIFTQAGTGASSTGIASAISGFYNSMSQLESAPSDPSLRQQVLSAATTLAGSIQSAAGSLQDERASLDQQSSTILTQVTALSRSIAGLNQRIESTSPNGDAGALEDQRQQDLLQLSQLIGIHTTTTEDNGLTVTTSSGAVLVSKDQAVPLTTTQIGGVTHFLSRTTDVTASLADGGGQLGGLLTVRDSDVPGLQSSLDQIAYGISTRINTQNSAGYDTSGVQGTNIFSPPATVANAASGMSVLSGATIGAAGASSTPGISIGATDDSNAIAMANSSNTVSGLSATTFYSDMVTVFGSNVSAAGTQNTAQQASLTQVQNQRDSLSAVNLDEEATAMSNLERSYQAGSKVFSILNSVMASAINIGVLSSVS